MTETTKIAVFKGKEIRKVIYNDEWWFVVEDVVAALTDSADPKQYINKMRKRDPQLAEGWVQFVHTLSIETSGGPRRRRGGWRGQRESREKDGQKGGIAAELSSGTPKQKGAAGEERPGWLSLR